MTDLRVAVIGVGHLGREHARILSTLPGVRLEAVVDILPERAEATAVATGSRASTDFGSLIGRVDAVTVAVPTDMHLAVARPFLECGTAVLVEKPMTPNLAAADDMIAVARSSGATLAVGHTERFNPAVAAASSRVTVPRFVEVHRLAAFSPRSLDIDVVLDLMIHDLDVVLSLVRSEVVAIDAVGVAALTPMVDIANARLRFASGCIANLTASRISRDRVRKVRFFQPDAYISIDYASQEVEAWRLVRRPGREPAIEGGKIEVAAGEPLALEMADFIGAVKAGSRPAVTGEDGRRALALAEQINERIAAQTPLVAT